ncbi:uncharacterized protein [Cicer arietinum]|uniref:Uncharacterized protein LOC101507395 isoform X1 n=1 Tax=Cicer arietinum TaxID=3827 RepID=A0A1S2Z7L5_CICAR|nr:uncharacterized protein LOC101507395 isoform X1 [Cicer arietinum]
MELVAELWQENFKPYKSLMQAWEAIHKNKSSNVVAPPEMQEGKKKWSIESNRFGFSDELPGRLSPFRRSRAAAAGISPCRSKPQSPFQGVKLLGDAKETEINKSGNLKFYSTGLGKVQGVPNQGAKRSSYLGSLAIEKTLYIDIISCLI